MSQITDLMLYSSHFYKVLMLSHMLEYILKGSFAKFDILKVVNIMETICYTDTVNRQVRKHSLGLVVAASVLSAVRQNINEISFVFYQNSLVQITAVAPTDLQEVILQNPSHDIQQSNR